MTVATIPEAPAPEPVYLSDDPGYDWQAQAGPLVTRWKADATGILGQFHGGPYALGLRLVGFTATNERAVGNILSFAAHEAQAMVSYRVDGGVVKERIKLLAPPPVSTLTITVHPQNAHLELAADGGLWAVSDLDGSMLARVPAPTCVDAKGVSGPARYDLSPDGLTVSLVLDAAWLRTAAYPVRIDPTVVTTPANSAYAILSPRASHVFRMSDGKLVTLWVAASNPIQISRAISTDSGATWTTTTNVYGNLTGFANWFVATQNGDNIYGAVNGTTAGMSFIKSVYAAGAFTDSSANNLALSGGPYNAVANQADCWYDTVKSILHVVAYYRAAASPDICPIVAFNPATMTITTSINSVSATNVGLNNPISVIVDTAASPNVYVVADYDGTSFRVYPFTFSGTTYTAAAVEARTYTGSSLWDVDLALDQSGNLDILYVDNGALKTVKRTGVNTYSAVTTLVASGVGVSSPNNAVAQGLAISRTGNANADIFAIYRYTGGQTNGEIYQIKRLNGSWQAATQVAGGNNTGWQNASPIDTIQSDGKVHMAYLTGTTTLALTYDGSLLNGVAPSAPINVLPTGNANTSLTPPTSSTYKNTATADALGKSRILVTRVSDSVVMWDQGAVAAPGAPTVAAGAAGNPNGAYRYAITFVTQVDAVTTGETASGTEAAPFTLTNQQGSLSAIPTGPAGTINRKVYRTAAGGAAGTEKYVGTIADNTTTTFLDNVADGSLGAAIPTVSTAQLGTAYVGAAITDGGTFSIAYAGTALAKGIGYQIQMQFWDALGNLRGPLSTAVTFQINDAPTVTVTAPTNAQVLTQSGLTVSWTFVQTLGHVQNSFQVLIRNAGDTQTIYDSGVQAGNGTTWTVPSGTLANNASYIARVIALSSDGL